MTIDFWACLIISQIYIATGIRNDKRFLALGTFAWFVFAVAFLFSTPVTK